MKCVVSHVDIISEELGHDGLVCYASIYMFLSLQYKQKLYVQCLSTLYKGAHVHMVRNCGYYNHCFSPSMVCMNFLCITMIAAPVSSCNNNFLQIEL